MTQSLVKVNRDYLFKKGLEAYFSEGNQGAALFSFSLAATKGHRYSERATKFMLAGHQFTIEDLSKDSSADVEGRFEAALIGSSSEEYSKMRELSLCGDILAHMWINKDYAGICSAYALGESTEKNTDKASMWFTFALNSDEPVDLLELGKNVPLISSINLSALKKITSIAISSDMEFFNGAIAYGIGDRISTDGGSELKNEALFWYDLAAKNHHSDGAYKAGMLAVKSAEKRKYLKLASSLNNPEASFELANEMRSYNLDEAKRLYREAAYKDHPEAMLEIAMLSENAEAFEWIRRAARLGVPEANFKLGMTLISEGKIKEGESHLALASSSNHPEAIFELYALGSRKDSPLAKQKLEKASSLGFLPAKLYLKQDYLSLVSHYKEIEDATLRDERVLSFLKLYIEFEASPNVSKLTALLKRLLPTTKSLKLYIEELLLELEDAQTMYNKGKRLLSSELESERCRAYYWFKKSAPNFPESLLGMSVCYEHGIGCQSDLGESVRLLSILEDKHHHPQATYRLAQKVENSEVEDGVLGSALTLFFKAHSYGHYRAFVDCLRVLGDKPSSDLKYLALLKKVRTKAQAEIAQKYAEFVVDNHPYEALHVFGILAKHGSREAAFLSGIHSLSLQDKYRFLKQAADQGHIEACAEVAECLFNGEGCEQDYWQACDYYLVAAREGHSYAMYSLGYTYLHILNDLDLKASGISWLQLAIKEGSVYAAEDLGNCFATGFVVDTDLLAAKLCFEKARELGSQIAEQKLASLNECLWDCYKNNQDRFNELVV